MMSVIAAAALAGAAPVGLEPLLHRLRLSVPDARAITDLQVCPAQQVSGDGRRFVTLVALSVPQRARRYYRVSWRDGRAVAVLDTGLSGDGQGLMSVGLEALERKFEGCRWVSAEELKAGWAALDQVR